MYQFYITDKIPHGDSLYKDKPARKFLPFEKFLLNTDTGYKDFNEDYDESQALEVINESIERNRKSEYGPWEKQFEMIFDGTWEAHVKSVKDRNPKMKKV